MGLTDGTCNMCKGCDSAKHWMSECTHPLATLSREETDRKVQQLLASMREEEQPLRQFIQLLADCVKGQDDGYMHRVGMIPHQTMVEIGQHLGIHSLTEVQRRAYHAAALNLGTLLMDGVLYDYINKRSNGRKDAEALMETQRMKRATRKKEACQKAAARVRKRKEKPKVPKQTRMTDFLDLQRHAYGVELYDPKVFGTEDGRRLEAGIG